MPDAEVPDAEVPDTGCAIKYGVWNWRMFEMQYFRCDSFRTKLILCCLVVGLVYIVPNAIINVRSKHVQLDFNTMREDDFKEGIYVKGDIYIVKDCFMKKANYSIIGRGKSIDNYCYMYLVPIHTADGQDKYLGVYVSESEKQEMDDLNEDIKEIIYRLIGSSEPYKSIDIEHLGSSHNVIGKLKAYNDEELDHLYSYLMKHEGYSSIEDCNKDTILYYINYEDVAEAPGRVLLGFLIMTIGPIILILFVQRTESVRY